MIYLTKNQDKCKEACDKIIESVHDNLKLLVESVNNFEQAEFEFENEKYLVARSLSFASVIVDKMVLINLYARNPLLAISKKHFSDELLYKDLDYNTYNSDWLYKSGHNLKSLEQMWQTLVGVLQSEHNDTISDFDYDFNYLKEVRNKYFHAFVENLNYDSFHLIRYNLWLLIIKLFEACPSYLNFDYSNSLAEGGLTTDKIETLENFDITEEERILLRKYSGIKRILVGMGATPENNTLEKRIYLLSKLYKPVHLNAENPKRDGDVVEIAETPEGETVEIYETFQDYYTRTEVVIDCPQCLANSNIEHSAYLSLSVDGVEYDVDNEGDAETWKEPIGVDLSFNHFYCLNCAVHSTDRYLLEKLGYSEVFSTSFNSTWDINRGVTSIYEEPAGPYNISDW